MIVYLSGPIYPFDKDATDLWRLEAKEYLDEYQIETLDPCRNKAVYTYGEFTPMEIVLRDLADVDKSDLLLVNFNLIGDKIPAGTLMEVMYAWGQKKPCVLVSTDERLTRHPWLLAMSVRIFAQLEDALKYVVEFWGEKV